MNVVDENWWCIWKSITYSSGDDEIYRVRYDGQSMMFPKCYEDNDNKLQGFTNNLEAYYQHIWIDGFYEKFNKRMVWYAKRQLEVTSETYDCLTIPVSISEINFRIFYSLNEIIVHVQMD